MCRIAHGEVFKDRVAENGAGSRLGEEREAGVRNAQAIKAEMLLPKMGVKQSTFKHSFKAENNERITWYLS